MNQLLRSSLKTPLIRGIFTPKCFPPVQCAHYAKESVPDLDKPLPYIGSPAETYRAEETRRGPVHDWPWYQPFVISGSIAIFLTYFGILREENDIDENLWAVSPQMELLKLRDIYIYNQKNNLPNEDIVNRLKELGVDVPDEVQTK